MADSRRKLLSEKRAVGLQMQEVNKIRHRLKNRLIAIKKALCDTPERGAGIEACDHSIVRFLERSKGVDVQAAEDELIALATNGDKRCVIRDGLIVTYLPQGIEDQYLDKPIEHMGFGLVQFEDASDGA